MRTDTTPRLKFSRQSLQLILPIKCKFDRTDRGVIMGKATAKGRTAMKTLSIVAITAFGLSEFRVRAASTAPGEERHFPEQRLSADRSN
jgi:hypothetical protein